ncbi:hypothetical protein V494_07627 [Pseudogymnoascus sp. VKM F-4513 (FW-928)]|nr:hypothetical protein V494_07627 [Pseudogymnoascus sp. VKM F-4513 (FW-928)]
MGFHGYGGSELDHSDCIFSPCSACKNQFEQQQPSVRSGNAYSSTTSNPDGIWSRANVFGNENNDSNEANREPNTDYVADNTEGLSGDFHGLSLSEEDRTLRDEMRQSGFRIPSVSDDPALSYQLGDQNLSEDPGYQYQNQYQPDDGRIRLSDVDPGFQHQNQYQQDDGRVRLSDEDLGFQYQSKYQQNDGRVRLSDEDRALRDEMRRSGFRIPSVSDDPAFSRPDDSQNRGGFVEFQAQGQYQEDNHDNMPSTGNLSSRFSTSYNENTNHCRVCQPNSGAPCSHTTYEGVVSDAIDDIAPWASEHPTNEETLRRALHNRELAHRSSQESAQNPQASTQPGTSSQGETGHLGVRTNRPTRQDRSGMHHDGIDDWEPATGRRLPDGPRGQAEDQNSRQRRNRAWAAELIRRRRLRRAFRQGHW